MRTLLFVVALLAALYAGYWFAASSQIETRAEAALAQLESEGWTAEHSGLAVTGFPLRFDIKATDLRLAPPDGNFVWEAPSFRVHAASYRPNRIVAIWPDRQTLTMAGRKLDISSPDLRASATLGLSPALPLDQTTIGGGPVTVDAGRDWTAGLDRLSVRAERSGRDAAVYDLFIEAEGLRPPVIDAGTGLLRLDAQVALDAPIGLRDGTTPRLRRLSLREVRLAQGDVALTGAGDLAPDAQGYLAGRVMITADNWRGLLDLLEAAGILADRQRPFLEGALRGMAQGTNRIEVPVTFANGRVEALGMMLLQAPRVF